MKPQAAVLYLSRYYAPTLKETPSDAELASHRLLLRAGMIRKMGSGLYSFLPLGMRVLNNITRIVCSEMDAIGAQQIIMPLLQPAELWHESGRWSDYGPELMRIIDRHDAQFCLGPTHEELICALVRNEVRSYKELPVYLYQQQVKYRDEIRPRFGLMRSREFVMNDGYSFHETQESLQKTYDETSVAYARMLDRMSLEWRAVEADSGQIGGKVSTEFMALADAGEAALVYCDCGYAADVEAGDSLSHPKAFRGTQETDEQGFFATPGIHSIEDLAQFLHATPCECVKALVGTDKDGNPVAFFIPGDHELNYIKAQHLVPGFTLMNDAQLQELGLPKGSIGPVGLPDNVRIFADESLWDIQGWVVGANRDGYHRIGARHGVDFNVDTWCTVCEVKAGDVCPCCGRKLKSARGIEVSQVFQLGVKYSESMHATFMNEQGEEQPFIMGCYGVGVSRAMAAIVEQMHDDAGIVWPATVAPAQAIILPLDKEGSDVWETAYKLADRFAQRGVEVALDDRSERPGVKFNDADLCGWPLQIIIGKRGLAAGVAELKLRATGQKTEIPLDELVERVTRAAQLVDCCVREEEDAPTSAMERTTHTQAAVQATAHVSAQDAASPASQAETATTTATNTVADTSTSSGSTAPVLFAQPYPNPYTLLFKN